MDLAQHERQFYSKRFGYHAVLICPILVFMLRGEYTECRTVTGELYMTITAYTNFGVEPTSVSLVLL